MCQGRHPVLGIVRRMAAGVRSRRGDADGPPCGRALKRRKRPRLPSFPRSPFRLIPSLLASPVQAAIDGARAQTRAPPPLSAHSVPLDHPHCTRPLPAHPTRRFSSLPRHPTRGSTSSDVVTAPSPPPVHRRFTASAVADIYSRVSAALARTSCTSCRGSGELELAGARAPRRAVARDVRLKMGVDFRSTPSVLLKFHFNLSAVR